MKVVNILLYGTKLCCHFAIIVLLFNIVATGRTERLDSYQEGDLNLGGMFPIHAKSCSCVRSSPNVPHLDGCHQIYSKGLFLAEAMIYAVRLVNRRRILPYNITLGYNIRDTCNTLNIAVQNALVFVTQRKRAFKQGVRRHLHQPLGKQQGSKQQDPFALNGIIPVSNNPSIIAVIGAGNSELSLAVTNILSLYNIPQVAYASSSAVFSDKTRYKTFLRVLPPDILQAKAIAQLLAHFKWDYVSLVSSDDHYAGPLRESLRKELQHLGICLANDITFSYLPSISVIKKALSRIKETPKSRVVLLFASERSAELILRSAESLNLTGRIWIASDSWSNAFSLFDQYFSILKGSIGIMFTFAPVKGFVAHLRARLNKSLEYIENDVWLKSLSVAVRTEKLTSLINNDSSESKEIHYDVKKSESVFARVDYVMNSVFILAYAIRDFCLASNINSDSSEASNRKSNCLENIDPQALLPLLFNKTLRGFSKNLTVDQNGDPHGSYSYLNLQESDQGTLYPPENIEIGRYESLSKVLTLNDSVIELGHGKGTVPTSRCSDICFPGSFVVKSHSNQASCCWECKICPPGQISNISMAMACVECGIEHVPNKNRIQCVYVPLRYLTTDHPWSIVISVCSLLCFFLALFFVWVFIRHRRSPVVRASCFEISIVLLLSIALGFLLPLIEISKPSPHKCEASAFLFAVIFAVILSLTLAKINRTVLILKNRTGSGIFHRKILLSSRAHFISVLILAAIQIMICMVWFFQNPPKPQISTISLPYFVRFLHCTSHKHQWFLVSSGFLIVLSIICTVLAFRSRNFPENYNHARFISLAMFTFNVVWVTFMGAYYGNPQAGIHQVIIHCCAIIFSNLCLMLLIYGPKVYVIYRRPELNNSRTFREMNLQHLLGGNNRGRTFSLASVGTQGHGNVYVVDTCDPNEKAVQTTRVFTYDVHTQTDNDENPKRRHKSSLVSKIFGRAGWKRTSDTRSSPHKRVWSESDATKTHAKKGLSHSQSSPISLCSYGQPDKRKRTATTRSPLDDFQSCDDSGLDRIKEDKDAECPATRTCYSTITNHEHVPDDRQSGESQSNTNGHFCYTSTNEHGSDNNDAPVNDVKYDEVFIMGDSIASSISLS